MPGDKEVFDWEVVVVDSIPLPSVLTTGVADFKR
jgi:hypothetical protein